MTPAGGGASRSIRFLLPFLLALSVLLLVSGGCGILPDPGNPSLPTGGTATPASPSDPVATATTLPIPGDEALRRILEDGMASRSTSIGLERYGIPKEQQDRIFALFSEVRRTRPSAYLCTGGLTYDYVSLDDGRTWTIRSVQPEYQTDETLKAADARLAALSLDGLDTVEKVRLLHDEIVRTTSYDTDAADSGDPRDPSYSADGLFRNGRAVCQGYAEALVLLLNRSGIPAVPAVGTSRGIAHAWVVVRIGEEWYHVDPTWDDPVPDSPGQTRYAYFLLTDAQIAEDHLREGTEPACTDGTYSWMHVMEHAVTLPDGRFLYSDASADGAVSVRTPDGGKPRRIPFRSGDRTYDITRGFYLCMWRGDAYLSNYEDSATIYRLAAGTGVLEVFRPEGYPDGVRWAKNLRIVGDVLRFDRMDENGDIVGTGSIPLVP